MKWIAAVIVIGILAAFVMYVVVNSGKIEEPSRSTGIEAPSSLSKSPGGHRQYTVLLDVSKSRPAPMILQGKTFINLLVDQMNYADRLVIVQMYEEGVTDFKPDLDVRIGKSDDVTSLDEKEHIEGARKGLKDAVSLFFENALKKPVTRTDILTTLSIASETISPTTDNCLIILSDMLQSSKDFEFEHLRHMPSSAWIDEQNRQRLIRPLYGSVVIVVGADPSTREGVVVRDFWQRYFKESTASLSFQNYRTTPPSETSVCN